MKTVTCPYCKNEYPSELCRGQGQCTEALWWLIGKMASEREHNDRSFSNPVLVTIPRRKQVHRQDVCDELGVPASSPLRSEEAP